jgi:hypothetical protein
MYGSNPLCSLATGSMSTVNGRMLLGPVLLTGEQPSLLPLPLLLLPALVLRDTARRRRSNREPPANRCCCCCCCSSTAAAAACSSCATKTDALAVLLVSPSLLAALGDGTRAVKLLLLLAALVSTAGTITGGKDSTLLRLEPAVLLAPEAALLSTYLRITASADPTVLTCDAALSVALLVQE